MHPALAALTPRQARDLMDAPMLMQAWISRHDIPYREAMDVIFDLFEDALDAPPAPNDPRRTDRDRLLEFVGRAEGLPTRLRQVARYCLEDGLSVRECGERLGIARETVRAHLRRLRLIERRCRPGGTP